MTFKRIIKYLKKEFEKGSKTSLILGLKIYYPK
jgi:hypothetical protein